MNQEFVPAWWLGAALFVSIILLVVLIFFIWMLCGMVNDMMQPPNEDTKRLDWLMRYMATMHNYSVDRSAIDRHMDKYAKR